MIPAHVKTLLQDIYGTRWGEAYIEWGLFNATGSLDPATRAFGRAATASPPDDRAVFHSAGLLRPGTRRADENVEKLMVFVMDDVGTVPGKGRIDPDMLEMAMPKPTSKPESSPGNAQWQWGITDGMDEATMTALRRSLPWQSHATAMSNLIRLPMGISGKPGITHTVTDMERGPVYTCAEFIRLCGGLRVPVTPLSGGSKGDLVEDPALLSELVDLIPNDARDWDRFVNVGRAIWGASGGTAEADFHRWAEKFPGSDAAVTQGRWDSYRDAHIGRFWLLREAQKADPAAVDAWVRKEADAAFNDNPPPVVEADMEPRMFKVDDFRSIATDVDFIHVGTALLWKAASVDANIAPVTVGLKQDGTPITMKATAWMRKHMYVTELSWLPGRERIVVNSCMGVMGLERRLLHSVFNLYQAPKIVPVAEVDARPWCDLVRRLWPDEYEEIMNWFAHRVQRPGEKINHALVLGGAPGIGKDTVLEAVRRAVGVANCNEILPSDLKAGFNDYVKSVLLVINELRDDGGISQYAFYDKSKTLIAAPPYVMSINSKYLKKYDVPNVCGVAMTTNYKQTGLYLPADDRRHLVCWSEAPAIAEGDTAFSALWKWLNGGGFDHVAAFLRSRDLSTFDPKQPPRKTRAFLDIVAAAGSVEEKALGDKIEALGKPEVLRISDLKGGAADAFDEDTAGLDSWLTDHKYRRVVAEALDRGGYRKVQNPSRKDGCWKVGSKNEYVYGRKDVDEGSLRALAGKLGSLDEKGAGKG